MDTIYVNVAGREYRLALNYSGTRKYFESFLSPGRGDVVPGIVPSVSAEAVGKEMKRLRCGPAFAEYSLLIRAFSGVALHEGCFLFHGAAFVWGGGAYMFTGRSGVGKTTQLRNWMQLYGCGTEVINGDKPVVSLKGDEFRVHPSPWAGKEGWKGTRAAGLKGIILLEQGRENNIRWMGARESVFPLLLQFLYVPDTVEKVDLVCGYLDALLRNVPVWKMVNDGSRTSTEMIHRMIQEGV